MRFNVAKSLFWVGGTALWLSVLAGCGMTPVNSQTGVVRYVVRQHGGTWNHPEDQRRAEALLADLQPYVSEYGMPMPRLRLLATDRPIALAVAPCDVFVSKGLLALASDDEVRAALAHELGHLAEEESSGVAALAGRPGMHCPEARADRFAVGMLSQAGYGPESMDTLLALLIEHPSTNESLSEHLEGRHHLLVSGGADGVSRCGALP